MALHPGPGMLAGVSLGGAATSPYTPRHMEAGSLDALWAADAGMTPRASGPETARASHRASAPTPPAVSQPDAGTIHPRVLGPRERSHA